jgi:adenylosuccinate lyase
MRRLAVLSCIVFLASATTQAATPEDAIKYRQAVMSTLAGHVGALTMIFQGKVEHQEQLLTHAEALAAGTGHVGQMFPVGSGTGKTEALPLIWEDAGGFQKAAEAGKSAAAALRDAVKSGDKAAIGRSLKPVFDSCKGCHDRYRKES